MRCRVSVVIAAWLLAAATGCPTRSPNQLPPPDGAPPPATRRVVILLIGDGMGKGQIAAGSDFAYGEPDRLFLQSLPAHGEITTGGPSGIIDSAAAATAIACGEVTYNGRIGVDRDGVDLANVIERAHARGWSAGVVVTSSLTDATPAAFTAHDPSRGNAIGIADDQALRSGTEVMLGGGASYFLPAGEGSSRTDDGLLEPLAAAGYQILTTATDLAQAQGDKLFGIFASGNLSYLEYRPEDSTEPDLVDMTRTALEVLNRNPDGFFLMVEGSLIDKACHGNNLAAAVAEVVAFDQTVAAVADWARGRQGVTILVTADHETGGLEVTDSNGPGELPTVSWDTGGHTNSRVDLFGSGPGSELFDGTIRDQRWINRVIEAAIDDTEVTAPPRVPVPDGDLRDLRHRPAVQTQPSDLGPGLNELDALHLDADRYGLSIGISGLFQRGDDAVVILIDADFGAATGPATLPGPLSDFDGTADTVLSSLAVDGSAIGGFGADLAVVVVGGADPHREQMWTNAGLRGLHPPYGSPSNLTWYGIPINFGDGVRPTDGAIAPQPFVGLETQVPWQDLYPDLAGQVPEGAVIAVAALLVDGSGAPSNQALPGFAASSPASPVALPGVVTFPIDSDRDGIGDGGSPPAIVSAGRDRPHGLESTR